MSLSIAVYTVTVPIASCWPGGHWSEGHTESVPLESHLLLSRQWDAWSRRAELGCDCGPSSLVLCRLTCTLGGAYPICGSGHCF